MSSIGFGYTFEGNVEKFDDVESPERKVRETALSAAGRRVHLTRAIFEELKMLVNEKVTVSVLY